MKYAIDRAYGFVDTWRIPRGWLQTIHGATVIGETCEGALTLIPCQGQTVDTLVAQLKAMIDPPTESQLIVGGEIVGADVRAGMPRHEKRSDTTGVSTGETDTVSHGNTDTAKARNIKHDRDTMRRQEQLSKIGVILRDTPDVSISELARQLEISRATVRALIKIKDGTHE
jgi:hypothetical protein